ncbi:DNA ligase-1 [Friedmanniella endophytica]|uniref:DNA ligase B n=1 Tax=Microlunatus kandeliicorticis TaxID=1759536 RepID=A0A7W3P4Q1_9ACTN|nr:ATP-dependent DNA ligase [Microlunatus kandeliicorticis]MBA8793139.1 DNA ligase-1 [Microlunatus kandeliicorticis]
MLFGRLAETWRALAGTRSRNAKRDILAALLREPLTGPDELEIVVSYLSGALRQRRTGVGYRALADPPPPAADPTLTVVEVDAAFAEMAGLSGPGSAGARADRVRALFSRATEPEQALLRGLVSGEVRQGALEAAVQDGLAAAHDVPVAAVRRAAMLLGSTPEAATVLVRDGEAGLAAVSLTVGIPVQPMLAASAPDVAEGLVKAGGKQTSAPVAVDSKLDGIRVQVHKDGEDVRVFTRSLDEITARLPGVVAAVAAMAPRRLVLDGEALALRPDGRPEAFQVSASRSATHARTEPGAAERPAEGVASGLRAYFFDLLRVDDRDLLDEPLSARLDALAAVVPADQVVPRLLTADPGAAQEAFEQAVAAGFEGVVIKNLDAPYAAGRRDSAWVKVKPRHTFDLVVTAVEWGHGRREGLLSNLHLAARDPATGGLVMLGKTFKGMTDEMLAWQTEHFLARETRRTSWTVHVEPTTVVEIACDGLQRSTRYPGGVALRFARVLRYRTDKSADEADTLETVRALAPVIEG